MRSGGSIFTTVFSNINKRRLLAPKPQHTERKSRDAPRGGSHARDAGRRHGLLGRAVLPEQRQRDTRARVLRRGQPGTVVVRGGPPVAERSELDATGGGAGLLRFD